MLITNTHKTIARLQEKGFSRKQGEGITETLQELDLSNLAKKSDIVEVIRRIARVQTTMTLRFVGLLIAQSALIVSVLALIA